MLDGNLSPPLSAPAAAALSCCVPSLWVGFRFGCPLPLCAPVSAPLLLLLSAFAFACALSCVSRCCCSAVPLLLPACRVAFGWAPRLPRLPTGHSCGRRTLFIGDDGTSADLCSVCLSAPRAPRAALLRPAREPCSSSCGSPKAALCSAFELST